MTTYNSLFVSKLGTKVKLICILTLLCVAFGACRKNSQTTNLTSLNDKEVEITAQPKVQIIDLTSYCRFDDRRVVRKVSDLEGIIEVSMEEYVLVDKAFRFLPCNLPDSLQIKGTKVVFSGEERAVKPNERWIASPFKLTQIAIIP